MVSPFITIFFLKSFLCEFYHCIFLQSFIIYFLIYGLLLSKFIQTCNTDGGIRVKNNLLIPLDGVFDSFFKFFLCFHTISTRYTFLQVLTVTSCSFIISFCNHKQVTKIFLVFFLHLKKSIIIITQHSALLVFCISVFTLFNINLRIIIFTFLYTESSLTLLLHCSTCCMEHLDQENLSLCVLSTFSTFHERTCLLLLLVLSPVYQIAVTQPQFKSFCIEPPTLFPQRH